MDTVLKIIAIGFIGTITVVIMRNVKPEVSVFVAIATGVIILIGISEKLTEVVSAFTSLADKSGLSAPVFSSVIRIIGIGYITEYAASVCEDNNCSSIAKKIQLSGKVIIFAMALPIITGIIDIVEGLLV